MSQKLWKNAKSIDDMCLLKTGKSLLLLEGKILGFLDSLEGQHIIHLLPVIPAA